MTHSTDTHSDTSRGHFPAWAAWLVRLVLAGIIICGGILLYRRLLATAPQHMRKPHGEREIVVEVVKLQRVEQAVTVTATGTVVPVRELSLTPQISGRVIEVHPDLEPGSVLPAGTVIVKLEQIDYELALKQAEATVEEKRNTIVEAEATLAVARSEVDTAQSALKQAEASLVNAEYSYKLELGEQDVARHEWALLEDRDQASALDRELSLRQPHLRKAEADVSSAKAGIASAKAKVDIAHTNVKSAGMAVSSARAALKNAEAALAQAQLNLGRTNITVPFDVVVAKRNVTIGTQVSTTTVLAELVDKSAFWIEVSLPYDRLKWITLPKDGKEGTDATVRISGSMADEGFWQGNVVNSLLNVEENGRQVRLLVDIPNPLSQNTTPLLLNTFVTVELTGPVLRDVFVIPRHCIHNGNEVWLRNTEGRMEIRNIKGIWGNENTVVIADGLNEGEELVMNDISSPVSGLKLALPTANREYAGEAGANR